MVRILSENPVLLLAVVAAIGFLAARITIAGFSLGVAAVLFAGLGAGAIDPQLKLPDIVWLLGLAIFVYTVGLASGPGFFAALRRRGLGANMLVVFCLVAATAVAAGVGVALLGLGGPEATGVLAGSLTNTPALAAAVESLKGTVSASAFDHASAEALVGYSIAYPVGVLLPLLAVWWLFGRREQARRPELVTTTAVVERDDLPPLGKIRHAHEGEVTFGRLHHLGRVTAALDTAVPAPGDLLTVVGEPEPVAVVVAELGTESEDGAELDRHEVDFRRVFVSRRSLAGVRIGDLDLQEQFGATITRVRRGDTDLLAHPHLALELGDRVRVVAPRSRMRELSAFFGDSYRALGEVDIFTFAVGLAAGLALGLVAFPIPGGGHFELGSAGGPLIVALCLGALGRTGPLVWQMPHTANLTLRQLGIVLFLAAIGTRAGGAFGSTIADPHALVLLASATLVTLASVLLALAAGRKLLFLEVPALAGVIAGIQTQPAVLGYATDRAAEEQEVNLGYATVYPLAIIAKILAAQILIQLLA